MTISQSIPVSIRLVVLQPEDLLDVLDLLVLHDLVVLRVTDVKKLSTEREYTIVVSSNDREARNG